MVHGFGISFSIWENLLPFLTPNFSLIMVELPGIGKSPIPDEMNYLDAAVYGIEAVRAELKIEKWCVLSYSSGTRVAEYYVRLEPQRIERIVYLCPVQVQTYKAIGLRFAKWLDLRDPRLGNYLLTGARLDFLIRWLGFNLKRTPETAAWMQEISSQPVRILKETLRSLPGDGGKTFAVPSMPHLFVWGKRDLITKTPRQPASHERIIPAPHAAPVTNAQEAAEVILPFLGIT
jgi:pimeloyl-ACP methyl ester carboxylesterase